MSKYDEAAVDELLAAIDSANMNGTNSRVDCALEALRPKPEMEYVLPEAMPDRVIDVYSSIWKLGRTGQSASPYDYWRQLREATRIPARPKVRAITADDVEKMWRGIPAGDALNAFFQDFADLINQKQGGQ